MIIAHFIETLGRGFSAWGRGGQERLEQGGRARENSPSPKSENMQFCMLMCALPKMKAGVGVGAWGGVFQPGKTSASLYLFPGSN